MSESDYYFNITMKLIAAVIAAILVIAAVAAFLIGKAFGHDQYGNANWISNGAFVSPIDGSHCCGEADCVAIDSKDVRGGAGGYVLLGFVTYGQGKGAVSQFLDETVPYREAQKSRDGQYWRCKKPDGSRRCFFAPPPSM